MHPPPKKKQIRISRRSSAELERGALQREVSVTSGRLGDPLGDPHTHPLGCHHACKQLSQRMGVAWSGWTTSGAQWGVNLVFLSARPESYKGFTEADSYKRIFAPLRAPGGLPYMPVLLLGDLSSAPRVCFCGGGGCVCCDCVWVGMFLLFCFLVVPVYDNNSRCFRSIESPHITLAIPPPTSHIQSPPHTHPHHTGYCYLYEKKSHNWSWQIHSRITCQQNNTHTHPHTSSIDTHICHHYPWHHPHSSCCCWWW